MIECLFCGIISGKIKSDIVHEDDAVVAFKDIGPRAPVHILIVPRKHIASLSDLQAADYEVVGAIFRVSARLAKDFAVEESGYRMVVNNGADAGQSVFHLHFHLLGGRQMGWPPG